MAKLNLDHLRMHNFELQVSLGPHTAFHLRTNPSDPADGRRGLAAFRKLIGPYLARIDLNASPPAALPAAPALEPPVPIALSEHELLAHWMRVKGQLLAPKSRMDYQAIHRRLLDFLREQKVSLARLEKRHLGLYKSHCLAQGMTPKTWNKHLVAIGGLLKVAQELGAMPAGPLPTQGLLFGKQQVRKSSTSWGTFTDEQLALVFDPDHFGALAKPHEFWAPLLCLHQGLRANEACQFKLRDFDFEASPPRLWVRALDADQRVKTEESERVLPIHPALLELGLAQYVADVRAVAGEGLLFPYLRFDQANGYQDVPSEAFSRYLTRRLGEAREGLVLHSMRKTANNLLKQRGVSEELRCQFLGHRHESLNSTVYANPFGAQHLAEQIFPHLAFPIDYGRLRYESGRFVGVLRRELRRREKQQRSAATRGRADLGAGADQPAATLPQRHPRDSGS